LTGFFIYYKRGQIKFMSGNALDFLPIKDKEISNALLARARLPSLEVFVS
jgi:hypothetical protein